jgi:hypothetical protein
MNRLALFTLLAFPVISFSQSTELPSEFAHLTAGRDTLFLLAKDPLSQLTFNIWKNDPNWDGTCPNIQFVGPVQMERLKKKYAQLENPENFKITDTN